MSAEPVQVVAEIAVRDGKVLLIRSRRHGVATPGGKVQPGEGHEAALRREMREETGLEVTRFGRLLHVDRQPTFHVHIYAVTVSDGAPVAGDDAEAAWWGSPAEILRSRIPRDYPFVIDVMAHGCDPRPSPDATRQADAGARRRVYVAGPILLGDRAANIQRGIAAGEAVRVAGFSPFIPFLNEAWEALYPKTHAEWMEHDYAWLGLCHAVLRLPGASKGADLEEEFARARGIPVFHDLAALVAWDADAGHVAPPRAVCPEVCVEDMGDGDVG